MVETIERVSEDSAGPAGDVSYLVGSIDPTSVVETFGVARSCTLSEPLKGC
jgi:hypothetical protein